VWLVSHRGNLHDVGVQRFESRVKLAQIIGRVAEAVIADDPLGLAEAGNLPGDVIFKIDILDAIGDRFAKHDQPGFFAADVLAAVLLAAHGDDRLAGSLLQQPLDIYARADVIQAQLDQLGTLFAQVLMFCEHVFVPATAD
jgi:hypothetical protein